jgi:hypothetical protein
MHNQRLIDRCTVYPETSSICGMMHHLVRSPHGDLFWVDDLFLELIRAHGDGIEMAGRRFSCDHEMIREGLNAIGELFCGEAAKRYCAPRVEESRHSRSNPLISIVIVNWNGEQHLLELIDSIRAQSYRRYEIIVVDNGSTDNSIGIMASCGDVRVLRQEENVGFCRGNNLGIRAANGEILLLLNNDTVP